MGDEYYGKLKRGNLKGKRHIREHDSDDDNININ